MRFQIALACAVLLVGVIACGDDDAMLSPNVVRDEKVVGPEGATLALSDGTKVEIPAGALLEPVTIVIREVDAPKPLPNNLLRAGKPYAFEPHGTLFAAPVKVTLPFEEDDGADNEERPIKLDDEDDDTWQTVVGADKSPGKLELEVVGFSFYQVVRPNRDSGVITLPDGATIPIDGGSDASITLPDATMIDANIVDSSAMIDANMIDASTDSGVDASIDIAVGSFVDANLELIVRSTLGIATDPLTQQDLDMLVTLNTSSVAIGSLVGLQHCHNLTSMLVPVAAFSSLRPIESLTSLTSLTLVGRNMTGDVSDLAGLTNLTTLQIDNTRAVGSLSDLSTLVALQTFSIGNTTSITGDLSEIASLNSLDSLNVSSTTIGGNLNALSDVVGLRELYIGGNNVTGDVSALSPLVNLQTLVFPTSSITGSISAFANMTSLQVLQGPPSLSGALASLANVDGLRTLNLTSSSVTGSLADLSDKVSMLYLDVSNTTISGALSALNNMTMLQGLNVASSNMSGDVSALSTKPNLLNVDLGFCTNVVGTLGAFAANPMLVTLNVTQTGITMDFGPLAVDAGARALIDINGVGNPIDCTAQADEIDALRQLGFVIVTDCDPI